MIDLAKVANVLDLMSEYVEQNEREKQAATATAHQSRVDKIASAHLAAHGEELPEAARQKLARTDLATLDLVEDLLNKQAGAVEPLGGPAHGDTTPPTSIKEAASAADHQFLSWIIS